MRNNERICRALLSLLCCLALVVGLGGGAGAEAAAGPEAIHLPVVEADDLSPSGRRTTWSCVWFGRYPSAEVVDDSWNAVDGYALREGDVIRDGALYERLSRADWQDGSVEMDGVSYLRVGLDSAPSRITSPSLSA